MLRSWFFRVGTVATLLLGAAAATASACNDPNLVLGQSQAGQGDAVGYSISGTDQGASYTLTVDGVSVESGADDSLDPGTTGTFTMPDLGNTSRDVEVRLLTTHEGNEWPSTRSILYTVAATSTTPSGAAAAPPSRAETATGSRKADPRNESRSRGDASGRSAGRAPFVAEPASTTGQAKPASGRALSGTGDKRATQSVASGARKHAATELRSRPFETPAGVAIPGYLLLALALVLLMGVGVTGLLVARRRPDGGDPAAVSSGLWTPPPFRAEAMMRGMLIEAELQEMIAERRAAMLLGPPEEAEQLHR